MTESVFCLRKREENSKKKQRKSPKRKCQSQPLDSPRLRSLAFAPGCPPPQSLSLKGLIYSTRRGRRNLRSGQTTGVQRAALVTASAALGASYSQAPPAALRRSPPPRPPRFSSTPFTRTKWLWSPQGLDRVLAQDITSSTLVSMAMGLQAARSWDPTTTNTTTISNSIHSSCIQPAAHH